MRKGLYPHPYFVTQGNVHILKDMDFVFLSLDDGPAKKVIVEKLEEYGISFVDTGIGVYKKHDALGGIVRVTTSTKEFRSSGRISFGKNDGPNEYELNIQTGDLNMLNAVMAVLKWKKIFGFYHDFDSEHHSTYTIDGNMLNNEDKDEEIEH